jgi:hypothetical protein
VVAAGKVAPELESAVRASLSDGVGILKTARNLGLRRRDRAADQGEHGGGAGGAISMILAERRSI